MPSWTGDGFIRKRIKELADIAGKRAIEGLLHAIESEHVLIGLVASVSPYRQLASMYQRAVTGW